MRGRRRDCEVSTTACNALWQNVKACIVSIIWWLNCTNCKRRSDQATALANAGVSSDDGDSEGMCLYSYTQIGIESMSRS